MGRGGTAQQDRSDRHAVAVDHLEHVEQDVGSIQVRADQQVGLAGERAVRHGLGTQLGQEGGVAVHLAVALDVRGALAEQVAGLAHLDGRVSARGAEL